MTGLRPSCGACKFLRRKCSNGCVFAPYFCYDEAPSHFSAVHKVFGASNVSKLLLHLPIHNRGEAAATISYEALARVQDPVYGCISHIYALQQQVFELQEEIETFKVYLANPILISQISQGMTNTDSSFQCPSQSDAMTMHDYFDEQPPDPFPAMNSNPVTTDTNPVVSPQCNLGHQNMCFDPINELDFFGRLSVGMNPLIPCSIEPWLITRDEL